MTVPVIIIGGFLGAGKTTAINEILRKSSQRVAVLVNDFGALNIDAHLIEAQDGEIFALANGCVCCSIGPDFSVMLARMLSLAPPPARIIVESSGVSDPWRIAQLVKLEIGASLEAVIVLADALDLPHLAADRWLNDTISRQIARADLIALSKCDIASAAMRTEARTIVTAIRADVPVIEIAGGVLPAVMVNPSTEPQSSRFLADGPDHDFRTWSWRPDGPLDEALLREVLRALPPCILRGKGVLQVGSAASPMVLQLVGQRWSLAPGREAVDAHELVLIGTNALPTPGNLEAMFAATRIK
jgi:G3E family GTPase